jgi:uncharacterized membrane protein
MMSQPAPQTPPHPPSADLVRKVELLISNLLRTGVISSLAVVIIGLVVSFVHHPAYLHAEQMSAVASRTSANLHSLPDLGRSLLELRGEAIIMAGLLLLIATPVMRVAVSIFAFIFERDPIFVVVTTFVLAMLILSFVLGKAGG